MPIKGIAHILAAVERELASKTRHLVARPPLTCVFAL